MTISLNYPRVYVQPILAPQSISGVSTATTMFVGRLELGPVAAPAPCFSLADFVRLFGAVDAAYPTSLQVAQFFANGGGEAWVCRVDPAAAPAVLPPVLMTCAAFNLLCVPDLPQLTGAEYADALAAIVALAETRGAFAIVDLPRDVTSPAAATTWAQTIGAGTATSYAAAYFPQVMVADPGGGSPVAIGPCGTMAGIYAATDEQRGVWRAPAGIGAPLAGVQALTCLLNDQENGALNLLGVNALRSFVGYGLVAWGARTLAPTDGTWRYVSVRRLALYIEQSLRSGMQWTVFEADTPPLRGAIVRDAEAFLHGLWLQGALLGAIPKDACCVVCDPSTTTAADMRSGLVNLRIDFAPVFPGEFVTLELQLSTAGDDQGSSSDASP